MELALHLCIYSPCVEHDAAHGPVTTWMVADRLEELSLRTCGALGFTITCPTVHPKGGSGWKAAFGARDAWEKFLV